MPGISSRKLAYRRVLASESRVSKEIKDPKISRIATLRDKIESEPIENDSSCPEEACSKTPLAPDESSGKCNQLLVLPRSRKLCNWKPNVSTVFEDHPNHDLKNNQTDRSCKWIRHFRAYLAAWLTPKTRSDDSRCERCVFI